MAIFSIYGYFIIWYSSSADYQPIEENEDIHTFYCGAYRVDRTGKEPVITGTTVYTYTKNLETESGDVLSPLEVRYNLNHGQVLGVGNGIAFIYQKEFRGDRTYETYGVGPATKYDDQLFY